jgi:lipoprotein-releasing system permease protein
VRLDLFIAKRILFRRQTSSFSKPIVRIAIVSIALGLAVMIVSVAVVIGFQSEIRNKVIGFGSHIQINKFDANNSFESKPIEKNQPFYPAFNEVPGIKHIQVYAIKPGIIKTDNDMEGVVLKGIGSDFNWDFFRSKIVEGEAFRVKDSIKNDKVLVSKYTASRLKLKVGDNLYMYFIQEPPRSRKFVISGIYDTGFEDLDKLYVLCDIAHIQKLNDWTISQVSGFEVLIDDFNQLDEMGEYVYSNIGPELNSSTISQQYPQYFDWLKLLDMNVYIILILMVLVASINMISTLLILILERTNMVGVLKALGAGNKLIRNVFLNNAGFIIIKGLLWGNLIGIALCLLQLRIGIMTLPEESYYIKAVPIHLNFWYILWLNVGTIIICLLMQLIPSRIIARISPVRAIRLN